ncbi:MAG: hypothetical protein KDJ35_03875 [Alphaproteobacteria bacterium]|nr:hypothetical protein [Alphaproteobacteria bacterium]
MTISTKTQITVLDSTGNALEKDSLEKGRKYQFNMLVQLLDEHDRSELLSNISYIVSSPDIEILGDVPNVKLSFQNNSANSTFEAVARKEGDAVMHVNVLQNFEVIDRLKLNLVVS